MRLETAFATLSSAATSFGEGGAIVNSWTEDRNPLCLERLDAQEILVWRKFEGGANLSIVRLVPVPLTPTASAREAMTTDFPWY